jgi:endoglucanase
MATYISVDDTVVGEQHGSFAIFTVRLSAAALTDIVLDFCTTDGTAVAGADYIATTGSVHILAGQTSATVEVPLINDTPSERAKGFLLNLNTLTPDAVLTRDSVTALITRNPPPASATTASVNGTPPVAAPVVSVQGGTVVESQGYVDFVVTLSAPGTGETSVDYYTYDGSAAAGTDYLGVSGHLVFAPGATSRNVRVFMVDSATARTPRSFNLDLIGVIGGTDGVITAQAVIIEDDRAVTTPSAPARINTFRRTPVLRSSSWWARATSMPLVTMVPASTTATARL